MTTNLQPGNNPPGSWAYGDLLTIASEDAQAWRISYINEPGFDPVRRRAGFTPLQGDFAEMNYFTTYAGNDMTQRQILSGLIEFQTEEGNWCPGAKVTASLNPAGR